MQDLIALPLQNFEVTTLVLAIAAAALSLARQPATERDPWEELLAFFLLFGIGFGFLYSGLMHILFGASVARFIGWPQSPFQAELGFASMGFAAVGFLSFRGGFGLRLAAVVGPSVFALGAAGVHLVDMAATGNFSPGNAGAVFGADIAGPAIAALLLWLRYRQRSVRPVMAPRSTQPTSSPGVARGR